MTINLLISFFPLSLILPGGLLNFHPTFCTHLPSPHAPSISTSFTGKGCSYDADTINAYKNLASGRSPETGCEDSRQTQLAKDPAY
jgi:hypothetical protein